MSIKRSGDSFVITTYNSWEREKRSIEHLIQLFTCLLCNETQIVYLICRFLMYTKKGVQFPNLSH